jgi:hypothetical protein
MVSQKSGYNDVKKGPCSQPMQHTQFGNHELKKVSLCSQKGKENKEQEYKVSHRSNTPG